MSKRKILLLALLLMFLALLTLYMLNFRAPAQSTLANPPPIDNNPENPKAPVLVVPENPLGTLGMISALAAGFGLFVMTKKKKLL